MTNKWTYSDKLEYQKVLEEVGFEKLENNYLGQPIFENSDIGIKVIFLVPPAEGLSTIEQGINIVSEYSIGGNIYFPEELEAIAKAYRLYKG